MAEADFGPHRAFDLQPHPAGEVLAEVDEEGPGGEPFDRSRREPFGHADRRHHLGDQRVSRDRRRFFPGRVVESRPVPAVDEDAGIVALAEVETVLLERAGRGLPALVREEDLALAALVFDLDPAGQARGFVAVGPGVPPVAEDDPDGVPVADEGRDVVGGVKGFLPVVRPAGIEDARPDLLPVQPQLVMAEPGDEDHGQGGPLLEGELPPEIDGAGLRVVLSLVPEEQGPLGPEFPDPAGGDPAGLPVPGSEEPRDEGGRLAPGAGPPFAVRPADLPEAAGAALQGFAGVGEPGRLGRGDRARVPEIADVALQQLAGRGDEDVAGFWPVTPRVAFDEPGQAGGGGVHAEGFVEVFAAEAERRARGHGRLFSRSVTGPLRPGSSRRPRCRTWPDRGARRSSGGSGPSRGPFP